MINFILGIFVMWFILAELICIGDKHLKQECDWDDWWIMVICLPAVIIQFPLDLLSLLIKIVKNCHSKKSKSK